MAWLDVGSEHDFAAGQAREVVAAGRIIAVCRVDSTTFALHGLCPHQGGPIGKGQLDGCFLTCPWHGLQLDVRDGRNELSPTGNQETFPTKIVEGRLFVFVENE